MTTKLGGYHDHTAALKNALTAMGVTAPHTGQPFTEAMLLGIGGGLGAGYILWEFKSHGGAGSLVMGFRNLWNYSTRHMTKMCDRINVQTTVQEAGGVKAGKANFDAAVAAGKPFFVCVDKASLPYQQLPESLKGYGVWLVGVYGVENGDVLVDDLSEKPYHVPVDIFTAARNVIPSDKNRIIRIEAPAKIDIQAAINAGLADCIEYLSSGSESFALPAYKKWSKMFTDTKNKKGWPVVFGERKGLFNALGSIYEGTVLDDTEGCGLRGMYADFLNEAADVVNKPALKEVAQHYRALADLWVEFAEFALPASVPTLHNLRDLLRQRYQLLHEHQFDKMRLVSDQIEASRLQYNFDFPMRDGVDDLFAELGKKLAAIYDTEVGALEALKAAQ